MRWATRAGVHIDRAACAWLLRRFIDPEASFVFVDDPAEVPADATAFDMRGVELGHHGGDCSFEAILRRYDLDDPVLWKLAELGARGRPGRRALRRPRGPRAGCRAARAVDDLGRPSGAGDVRAPVRRPLRVLPARAAAGPGTGMTTTENGVL